MGGATGLGWVQHVSEVKYSDLSIQEDTVFFNASSILHMGPKNRLSVQFIAAVVSFTDPRDACRYEDTTTSCCLYSSLTVFMVIVAVVLFADPDDALSIKNLVEVLQHAYSARARWKNIGLVLGLDPDDVESIHGLDDGECLKEALENGCETVRR